MTRLTHRDLVLAHLDVLRHEHAHQDLKDFYARRYAVLSELFGVDLTKEPSREREWDDGHIHEAFLRLSRFAAHSPNPFSGWLEAPHRLMELIEPYQSRLGRLASEQEKLCLDLVCDLCRAIHGELQIDIADGTLEARGVASSQAPDPFDYF